MRVKHFAKLLLFFSVSFFGILLISSLFTLFEEGVNHAVLFPPGDKSPLNALHCIENSVPAAFFISILISLSYASRRRLSYPVVFIIILMFSLIFSSAVYVGIEKSVKSGGFPVKQAENPALLAQPGYIYNPGSRDTRYVFLQDPHRQGGPIVVASSDLYYQRQGASLEPSPLPFEKEKNGILESIIKDFTQCSVYFTALFRAGSGEYWVYAGSLAMFLLSLGCLFNISYWHLANLFFAAVVFRGALALDIFLNQTNISGILRSAAGGGISSALINPSIYLFLTALILVFSGLFVLARGRKRG
jgi:hypothetical protein